ncbi:hypothetical protein JCM14036_07720 [Desulfotomaculum defluvii]
MGTVPFWEIPEAHGEGDSGISPEHGLSLFGENWKPWGGDSGFPPEHKFVV